MYQSYFGLTAKPFPETPNTKLFYLSPQHREGLAHLEYNILDGKGFTVLVGEVGAGKTTICKALIERLDSGKVMVAHVIQTNLDFHDFLREVVEELGLSSRGLQKWDLLKLLNDFLVEAYGQNRKVVLIIDEAQNLEPKVLEGIRMLSNLETAQEKLIQIVLVGQPGLLEHIQRKDMLQLSQRIAGYFFLRPLSEKETREYILSRMSGVQTKPSLRFTSEALSLIYRKTNGIPRLINFLCDYSIREAFVADVWTVDTSLVKKAYEETKEFNSPGGQGQSQEGRIVCKLPEIQNRDEVIVPIFKPLQVSGRTLQNISLVGAPSMETSQEENFFLPDKKSMMKRVAVVLGLVVTLGGLGTLVFWGSTVDLRIPRTPVPVYQIKIPVDESESYSQSNLFISGKRLGKITQGLNE
jgi:general secretion pathway protein A